MNESIVRKQCRHYLAEKNGSVFGISGLDGVLNIAMLHESKPEGLVGYHFQSVSREVYEDTVIDLRFEEGEWVQ